MEKVKRFIKENVIENPIVRRYSRWAFLIGSIAAMVKFGLKALLIIVPASFLMAIWTLSGNTLENAKAQGIFLGQYLRERKKEKKEAKKQ